MPYQIIVADPPWKFSDRLKNMGNKVKRGAEHVYKGHVLSIADIKALPIRQYADPNGSVLALWVPSTMLQDGLDTMKAWGFVQKQTFVWVKLKRAFLNEVDANHALRMGMGHLQRQCHEIGLIGTMGSPYGLLMNRAQRSTFFDEAFEEEELKGVTMFDLNHRHSQKPEVLQDRFDMMFPTSQKLELFARRTRPSWTCLGNEIDGKDIRQALSEI